MQLLNARQDGIFVSVGYDRVLAVWQVIGQWCELLNSTLTLNCTVSEIVPHTASSVLVVQQKRIVAVSLSAELSCSLVFECGQAILQVAKCEWVPGLIAVRTETQIHVVQTITRETLVAKKIKAKCIGFCEDSGPTQLFSGNNES